MNVIVYNLGESSDVYEDALMISGVNKRIVVIDLRGETIDGTGIQPVNPYNLYATDANISGNDLNRKLVLCNNPNLLAGLSIIGASLEDLAFTPEKIHCDRAGEFRTIFLTVIEL